MTHFKTIFTTILLLSALVLPGCNDEVFTDRPDLTGDVTVDIVPAGETRMVRFAPDGLGKMTVSAGRDCLFTVVSRDGNSVNEYPDRSVAVDPNTTGRVEITSAGLSLTIIVDTRQLEIWASDNISTEGFSATVDLDYTTRHRTVSVNVAPGGLLEVIGYSSPDQSDVRIETEFRQMPPVVFENNTDNRQSVTINPYDGLACDVSFSFSFGNSDNRLIDMATAPEVPVISGDENGAFTGNRYVRLSDKPQKAPLFLERMRTFSVPPHSKYKFSIEVKYSIVDSPFKIICRRDETDYYQTILPATMLVEDPIDFTISYEKID